MKHDDPHDIVELIVQLPPGAVKAGVAELQTNEASALDETRSRAAMKQSKPFTPLMVGAANASRQQVRQQQASPPKASAA